MEPREKPPGNLTHLQKLIAQLTSERGESGMRMRTTIANTVVAQMLPAGAVKGGSAMKLRLGDAGTRFTGDLDFARQQTLEKFLEDFAGALERGWCGFTGRIVAQPPAKPKNVPADYIMQPYEIRLAYKSKSWCSVIVEVGHDELGDTLDPKWIVAPEIVEIFKSLGLEEPAPLPVLAPEHQIAQKLHALTAENSQRAHDLIDLQLLVAAEPVDLVLAQSLCARLFTSRKKHAWPPTIVGADTWPELYTNNAEGVANVAPEVAEAIAWGTVLIDELETAAAAAQPTPSRSGADGQ